MIKTGIFGGSFNPVHNGHIALARRLLTVAHLDEVWMMVTPQNPLKRGNSELLDDKVRMEMLSLALQGEKHILACDFELSLPKPSYSWYTLQSLSATYSDRKFVLLLGADNWLLFDKWQHHKDILMHYEIIIYPRSGSDINKDKLPEGVKLADTELLPMSSTEIRSRIKAGDDIGDMVPKPVKEFIEKYNLYV